MTGYGPRPVFWGLALVTVGVLFLLREFEVVPDISFFTLLWLGIGGWLLIGTLAGNRRGWFWPLALLGIGGVMLARDLGGLRDRFSIWPVVIIALGLSILLQARDVRRNAERSPRPWEG